MASVSGDEIFLVEAMEACLAFPTLAVDDTGSKPILRGDLQVIDSNGHEWGRYEIEIHPSPEFPARYPALYETSGKIPRIGDWHIYEDTGACCVNVLPAEILRCRRGITVTEYIQEEVIPYLFNQTHRRVEGYYVNGEYGHGLIGVYEFYRDLFGKSHGILRMIELMREVTRLEKPQRTSTCFCGSGQKYRHCHKTAFEACTAIGREVVAADADRLERVIPSLLAAGSGLL